MLTREPRIIPARAGFTRTTTRPAARQRDHPRSRGVYPACRSASRRTAGSSPLARGLRQGDRCCDAEGRIIPARAGFTRQPGCLPPRHPDHPRSRGVYARFVSALTAYSGSSPLARGLLRASCRSIRRLSDHPRSRGVYATVPCCESACRGSSPLARGLLALRHLILGSLRIIPARAGFTPGKRCQWLGISDHPRSRGVYGGDVGRAPLRQGSSPLARGLPQMIDIILPPLRIIPARAGFTRLTGRPVRGPADHPRSRGVYR